MAKSQTVPGNGLLIEANLTQTGNQVTTQTNGLFLIGFITASHEFLYGGTCPLAGTGQNTLSGTVSNSTINITFQERGNSFTGTGTISPDGRTITGTYQGTSCADAGTFTATTQAPLSGTHTGTLSFLGPTPGSLLVDNVSMSVSTAADLTVTITGTTTGAHAGSINLTGHGIGNTVNATGTYAGTPITFLVVMDSQGVVGPQKAFLINENDATFFFNGILP